MADETYELTPLGREVSEQVGEKDLKHRVLYSLYENGASTPEEMGEDIKAEPNVVHRALKALIGSKHIRAVGG